MIRVKNITDNFLNLICRYLNGKHSILVLCVIHASILTVMRVLNYNDIIHVRTLSSIDNPILNIAVSTSLISGIVFFSIRQQSFKVISLLAGSIFCLISVSHPIDLHEIRSLNVFTPYLLATCYTLSALNECDTHVDKRGKSD